MKNCKINHSGSSGEMEASGAFELFFKSIETEGCAIHSLLEMKKALVLEKLNRPLKANLMTSIR